MTYIQIKWTGKATYGGFLSIDGEEAVFLDDTLLIPVNAGTHHLQFYGISPNRSSTTDSNATIEIQDDEYIVFEVFSDANKNVLSTPSFSTYELSNDQRTHFDSEHKRQVEFLFNDRIKELNKDLSLKKREFITCLLFGYLGFHKYPPYKTGFFAYLAAWFYLCTAGGFFILWIRDTINIGKEKKSLKNYIERLKEAFENSTLRLSDVI